MKTLFLSDGTIVNFGRNKYNNLGRYCDLLPKAPVTNSGRRWRVIDDNGYTLIVECEEVAVEVTLDEVTNLY